MITLTQCEDKSYKISSQFSSNYNHKAASLTSTAATNEHILHQGVRTSGWRGVQRDEPFFGGLILAIIA